MNRPADTTTTSFSDVNVSAASGLQGQEGTKYTSSSFRHLPNQTREKYSICRTTFLINNFYFMSTLILTEKNLKYEVIDYFQTIVNEMISVKTEIIPYYCCQLSQEELFGY